MHLLHASTRSQHCFSRGDFLPHAVHGVCSSTPSKLDAVAEFYKITAFGSVCDIGHIPTSSVCQLAAARIDGLAWQWDETVTESFSPRGCFCYGRLGDCQLRFNQDDTNPAGPGRASVCQRMCLSCGLILGGQSPHYVDCVVDPFCVFVTPFGSCGAE